MLKKHLDQERRYSLPYDIVNLQGGEPSPEAAPDPGKKLGPVRNIYNVINNQLMP